MAALYLEPDRERSATELAALAQTSLPNASREIGRLVTAGYALGRSVGRTRLIRVNRDHPLFEPVATVLRYAYGPLAVLPQILHAVHGVERAFIYGSWAARLAGEEGPDPADIDVLLVGENLDLDAIVTAEDLARTALGRDVNVRAVTSEVWERADDPFLANLHSRPLVSIPLEDDQQ